MGKRRLDRLARLTQGAALVGIGLLAGCKDEPTHMNTVAPEPEGGATTSQTRTMNATATPPSATASASAAPSASAATSASAAPSTVKSTTPPAPTKTSPPHVNALPNFDPK